MHKHPLSGVAHIQDHTGGSLEIMTLIFDSQHPCSGVGFSGNHHPCWAWTTFGCMVVVSLTFCFIRSFPLGVSIHTYSPSFMPSFLAVSGWTSIMGSGIIFRSAVICRPSEWKYTIFFPPVMRINGYSFARSGVLIGLSGGSIW